jgi:D-alanine-D-alanine ligase
MRIAVLANLKENAPIWEGMSPDQWDDLDSPKTIQNIVDALESGGHEATFFEASILSPHNLIENLTTYQPDLCFNIAEGHFGNGREAHIPAILEMLRIPYTGSKVLTLALALDKPMTKRVLTYHNLPTPEFQVFERADDPIDDDLLDEDDQTELRYRMFAKPSREGTGMGISAESIVSTVEELRTQVQIQLKRYTQPILCERYIKGREVTVGVIGNLRPTTARRINERTAPNTLPEELTFFPPLEVALDAYDPSEAGLYTSKIKVELAEDFHYLCPAPLDQAMVDELNRLTAAVFRVTGSKDVARVDFRIDEDNNPYILEVNPLPGLNPKYSDLCIEAKAAGWSYEKLINTIVELAAERYHIT